MEAQKAIKSSAFDGALATLRKVKAIEGDENQGGAKAAAVFYEPDKPKM